jgi:putative nucleotidyltransferase with HDIG domain
MSRFYPTGKLNFAPTVQPKLIDQVLQQVEHLPTLPQVVMTVLQMTESPNLNTAKLSQALDQSLAAKVLKMANSAFYGGGRSRKVNTIPHAIVIIGLETLKEIVLTASLFHTFHDQQDIQKLQPLWQHSLEAAQIAKRLAWIFRYSSLDEAYFSGLIHDLGKLIIQQHFPQQYEEIENQKNNGLEDQDAEKQVLGLNHAELGGKISAHWVFPETLVDAIIHHHDGKWQVSPSLGRILFCADRFILGLIDFPTMLEIFNQGGMFYPKDWNKTDLEGVEKILREEIQKAQDFFNFTNEIN